MQQKKKNNSKPEKTKFTRCAANSKSSKRLASRRFLVIFVNYYLCAYVCICVCTGVHDKLTV